MSNLTQFESSLLNEFKGILRRENPHDGRSPFTRENLIEVIKKTVRDLEEMKEE